MRTFDKLAELAEHVGQEIGVTEWMSVDQQRIQQFADATDDQQWIHTNPEMAAKGPFKTTIAHGFLTLSLLPRFYGEAFRAADVRMGVNYGLNKVRFPAPVPVDSKLRARFKLIGFEPVPGGAQLTVEVTVEREGSDKPVCVAESLTRQFV